MSHFQSLRGLALISVIANVAFNALYEHLGLGLENIRTLSDRYHTLFTPAPFAFAIWGAIYLSLTAYAIFALLPSQREITLHDRLAPPFILANVLGSAWIVTFTTDHPALAALVLAANLVVAMALVRRCAIGGGEVPSPHLVLAPFTMLLGWLSVAMIANASEAIVAHGGSAYDTPWAIVMLTVALVLGLLVALRFADGVYLAVLCWASIALAIGQADTSHGFAGFAIGVAVVSGLASLAVIALLIARFGVPRVRPH